MYVNIYTYIYDIYMLYILHIYALYIITYNMSILNLILNICSLGNIYIYIHKFTHIDLYAYTDANIYSFPFPADILQPKSTCRLRPHVEGWSL